MIFAWLPSQLTRFYWKSPPTGWTGAAGVELSYVRRYERARYLLPAIPVAPMADVHRADRRETDDFFELESAANDPEQYVGHIPFVGGRESTSEVSIFWVDDRHGLQSHFPQINLNPVQWLIPGASAQVLLANN